MNDKLSKLLDKLYDNEQVLQKWLNQTDDSDAMTALKVKNIEGLTAKIAENKRDIENLKLEL